MKYDYIIVGAGSAGAAFAYRRSANPRTSVPLFETGSNTRPFTRTPISFGPLINKPGVNWRYFSEPEERTGGRRSQL